MTDEEKVKAKYPSAYVACSWADGKLVAFIYNPSVADGEAVVSENFDEPGEAWADAAKLTEASKRMEVPRG